MTIILFYSNGNCILDLRSYTQVRLLVFLEIFHVWSSRNVNSDNDVCHAIRATF
jgi:hypothetical protein